MYPMLQYLPDVMVHFAKFESNDAQNGEIIKRTGINIVYVLDVY